MLGIIQKKIEPNENWRKSSLGLLQTMTALLPKFKNVTLVCDDSLTIMTHKVKNPYPLVYVRGRGRPAPSLRTRRDRGGTIGN